MSPSHLPPTPPIPHPPLSPSPCLQELLVSRLHGDLSLPHTVMMSSLGFALCKQPRPGVIAGLWF
jgi:hypothetical protein